MSNKKTGVIAILAASLMWALEPIFAKLAYKDSDFISTSAIRAVIVTIIAAIYISFTNRNKFKATKKQIPKLIYLGVAGTVGADLLYFFSLTKIPVVNAVLIGHLQPVFLILISFVVLKEDKLSKYDYIGIFIMMLAGIFVSTKTLDNLSSLKLGTLGDLFVLSATILWATTATVMRKYLKDLNSGIITFYRFLTASVIFIIYLFFNSSFVIPNIYQILLGVIVGIGTILFYESLKRIKAAQVAALELSSILYAAILVFFILNETVTIMQICGIVMLTLGIFLLSRKEETHLK